METKIVNRTILILDCHPTCKEQSSQCDEYNKNLPPRSIWSCLIEGVHEYSRIFYDLFDFSESMLSIHISNGSLNEIINNWTENEQLPEQISKGLLSVKLENIESKVDRIENSIMHALESLITENETTFNKVIGRIVLLLLNNSNKYKKENEKSKNDVFRYYESEDVSFDMRDILSSIWKKLKNKYNNSNKLDECIFDIIKISDMDDEYVNTYTQDAYYYQVNDDIILSVYNTPILKILNSVRNLIQLQKNLYTLTITDIPIKITTGTNNSYSINLLYTGNRHLTTKKREKKRFYENSYFNNRITFIKWRSGKPLLKTNNSTTCIHKITPMDISNDITNLFINAILKNNTFFYFTSCEERFVTWNKDQPEITHMIYFDNGNLLLACIDKTRPNIINLSSLPKVKEVCKLQCEDFENIIEASTIPMKVPIKSSKDIESIFFNNKENDFILLNPYENGSKNRLRELSFIENPKEFKIIVPRIINELTLPLASIDEKSPVYIGEPAKLLKPFTDNYINEELNENIMTSIRSALKILTTYYNENNKSLFPSISNIYKRKILYEILIRDLRQIGEKYKDNSDLHKTIYNYIEKHFSQDDTSSVGSRPSTPSKLDSNAQDSWEKDELNNTNNSSSKKSVNRLSNTTRTSSPYSQKNSRSLRTQTQSSQSQSRIKSNSNSSKPISYLVVNKQSEEEIQNDKDRKDNGEKGSLFNLYWNNKENQRSILMTYLNGIGGYGWKLENREDFVGRNGLNLDKNEDNENVNSSQDSMSVDNVNVTNNNANNMTINRSSHGHGHSSHSHINTMNSNNSTQKDGNNSSIKHTNKKN